MVFDQQTYDQMEEISEVGADVIVAQAETIGALAEALQMPAGTLENTIAYYNEYAQKGEDPLWMKRPAVYETNFSATFLCGSCHDA